MVSGYSEWLVDDHGPGAGGCRDKCGLIVRHQLDLKSCRSTGFRLGQCQSSDHEPQLFIAPRPLKPFDPDAYLATATSAALAPPAASIRCVSCR
jgi:hypothetical protein